MPNYFTTFFEFVKCFFERASHYYSSRDAHSQNRTSRASLLTANKVCAQLCFAHELASTSSCWSVKSSCKHEIYPDLAWHVNCNLKLLTPPVRGPIMCRITRNRINVFYFFDSRRCCTSTCRRLCLNLWSDIIIAYPLKSYKRTNAFLCTFFNTSGVQPGRFMKPVGMQPGSSTCAVRRLFCRLLFSAGTCYVTYFLTLFWKSCYNVQPRKSNSSHR